MIKSSQLGGARSDVRGGGASVRHALGVQRCERGGEHQDFGLHEGQVGQSADHLGRLLAQVLLLPGLPVHTGSDIRASGLLKHTRRSACSSAPDLVEVLVLSMVDISLAKASTTRLLELDTSILAVVSSYSSGSTPGGGRQEGFYCGGLVAWATLASLAMLAFQS